MHWIDALAQVRAERVPAVLVTLIDVRGHSPREAGAKMVVAADDTWGSVGGGNLEETAVRRARGLLAGSTASPMRISLRLNDRERAEHGLQCCGGEVELLLEPVPVRPAIAIFGLGHVGWELALVLARHDVDLHLIDSRADQVRPERLAELRGQARIHAQQAPVPELALADLPAGTHVLVMTHDHGEDAALVDAALRRADLGFIGLIGSRAKWTRFRAKLMREGHTENELERVTTPIGLPDLAGKEPATIAVSVAADLLKRLEAERAKAETVAAQASSDPTTVRPGTPR